jgi:hypothetical protein
MEVHEAIQRALVARMLGNWHLAEMIGRRVFDDAPVSASYPYVSVGPITSEPVGDGGCLDGVDVVIQIDVWSRAPGRTECGRIVDLIARDLTVSALPLPDHAPAHCQLQLTRVFDEGAQRHGVVQIAINAERAP